MESLVAKALPDPAIERAFSRGLIEFPDVVDSLDGFYSGALGDFHAKEVANGVVNLLARGERVSVESVRDELFVRRGLEDARWFETLAAKNPPQRSMMARWWSATILPRAERRGALDADLAIGAHDAEPDEEIAREMREEHERTLPPPSVLVRGAALLEKFTAAAAVPFIDLTVGRDPLARCRLGGTVTITAGSGAGKTSLASCAAVEHARDRGPALVVSLELPVEELAARIVGQSAGESWEAALTGRVEAGAAAHALALPRLAIIDRTIASLATLKRGVEEMRADFPGEPLLIVVDYVQLVESAEREIRARVGDVMRSLSNIARASGAVVVALSQTSRAAARSLSKGESIGRDSMDSGAESADIERWSSITLALGSAGQPAEDGSTPVELSIGKDRMGGGDRVVPMRYHGRTGLWRIAGESRPAHEVRADRASEGKEKRLATIRRAILELVRSSCAPMSRAAITEATTGNNGEIAEALKQLVRDRELVPVESHRRGGHAPLWTPDHLTAEGNS